jgi:hypothetical protein
MAYGKITNHLNKKKSFHLLSCVNVFTHTLNESYLNESIIRVGGNTMQK